MKKIKKHDNDCRKEENLGLLYATRQEVGNRAWVRLENYRRHDELMLNSINHKEALAGRFSAASTQKVIVLMLDRSQLDERSVSSCVSFMKFVRYG